MLLPPPISTLTYTPFPSTTPFRSRDRGDDFGLGHLGMFGKFRAQVFLSVVQRVLHQRRVGTCEGRTQLREVFGRSEEHTSELQSLMRRSYAVFCLKKKKKPQSS